MPQTFSDSVDNTTKVRAEIPEHESPELEILSRVSQLAFQELDLSSRLWEIANICTDLTRAEACAIYVREGQRCLLKAVFGNTPEEIEDAWQHLKTANGEQMSLGHLMFWESDHYAVLRQQEDGEVLRTVLAAPLYDDDQHQCTGIITLWSLGVRDYTPAQISMITTLASQISGMIKTARLQEQLDHKLQEQQRTYEVGKALSSTLNLDELLDLISQTSAELTHARGCVLRLLNREQTLLEIKSSYGDVVTEPTSSHQQLGHGIAGHVAETGEPLLIEKVTPQLLERETIKSMQYSLVCVPITGKEGVIGTIVAFDKNPNGDDHNFSEEDVNLLTSFAGHAAIAIEHARFYERMEELALDNLLRLRELSILYHINTAMRSTVKLHKLLRIILTGVTIGGGLGFNRALLLMVDDVEQTLQGMLGVGPGSGQEANQIWQSRGNSQKSLVEMITDVPDEDVYEETAFEKIARSIWMPLASDQGIFARTVLEKRAFNITDISQQLEDCQYIANLLDTSRFATVPLIVRDRAIGVIYVDNKYNNVPISEEDMNFLQMFANQAALAIDNAMLYANIEQRNFELRQVQDQLVQMEKMTALGKMAASIAHEIRNPIICVGGFARRLLNDDTLSDKNKKYVNIISEEATRLETILQDILIFSKDAKMNVETCDVNTIIKSALDVLTLEIHDREVDVNTCFFTELSPILADAQQLKQVFMNLITNALQQVPEKKGLINIMTYNSLAATGGITVEVSDNGGGIAPELIDNIFNPFFTTKGTGTGLGLAIIRKIIENHKGNINVRNRPGVGVTFVINLPLDPRPGEAQ
ncbi:GAF domain-containing protein [candidate division KSB3 bacterium]|uniref:histidine kinase n=1 Tax=candidate division KSB3 bacterium TaxID=2044937 RepID=A0A9D5Q7S2_9BACT|nr:GAF domain-containing protein [candidate division KSB3 bacterium]MBD3326743.1 GAF domain-containing protein [candidate division KSB3 bacterium]